jgi:hypothetical protein
LTKRYLEDFTKDTATRVHTDFTNMYGQPNSQGWNISPMHFIFNGGRY